MNHPFLQPLFAARLACLVVFVGVLSWAMLPTAATLEMLEEQGPIENATVLLWYLAIIVLWALRPHTLSRRTALAIQWVMMAMVARELDLHKNLTGMSMLKIRFWTGNTPLESKLIAFCILAPLLYALFYLATRYWRWLRTGVSRLDILACTVGTFFAAIVVSKTADRSLGILTEWSGYVAPASLAALVQSIEEPLEMLLPVLIIVAVAQASILAMQKHRMASSGAKETASDAGLPGHGSAHQN